MSQGVETCDGMSCGIISCRHVMSQGVETCDGMSCGIISYHVMPCHVTSYHVMTCDGMSCVAHLNAFIAHRRQQFLQGLEVL